MWINLGTLFATNQEIYLPKKGKGSVGALSGAEKGNTLTGVTCVSATRVYVTPPQAILIVPRVHMKPDLMVRLQEVSERPTNMAGSSQHWFDHSIVIVQPAHRPEKSSSSYMDTTVVHIILLSSKRQETTMLSCFRTAPTGCNQWTCTIVNSFYNKEVIE